MVTESRPKSTIFFNELLMLGDSFRDTPHQMASWLLATEVLHTARSFSNPWHGKSICILHGDPDGWQGNELKKHIRMRCIFVLLPCTCHPIFGSTEILLWWCFHFFYDKYTIWSKNTDITDAGSRFSEENTCAMVKSRYIGDGHPTFNRNPDNGYINPYYRVDIPYYMEIMGV